MTFGRSNKAPTVTGRHSAQAGQGAHAASAAHAAPAGVSNAAAGAAAAVAPAAPAATAGATNASPAELEAIPYSPQDFRDEIRRVRRKRKVVTVLLVILALLVALALVAVVVFKIPGSLHTVTSSGLAPTISQGQIVRTEDIDAPTVGDIVVYAGASGSEEFGRVIAVAGDWANVSSDGSIVVSEVSLEGSMSPDVVNAGESIIASRQVPEGACFVKTQDSLDALELLNSFDSPVSYSSIIGRVSHRVWPLFG